MSGSERHVRIHVTGIVQGVGMRPFVYREAVAHGIRGWVLNAADGVHIDAAAPSTDIDAFVRDLRAHAPAAARIERFAVDDVPDDPAAQQGEGFSIIASDGTGARTTLVSPDIATCDDCLRELFDPADRRFHYPFINCTNCGPRFTIIRSLPYDRPATSMDAFPMCPDCAREYRDPADRRFHAQPDACFACGPHITWREREDGAAPRVGRDRAESDAIIERCAVLIASGGIVAIKGLGGFHLACNAADEQAVCELRRRKRRSRKPLAIMARNLDVIEPHCHLDDVERGLLTGSVRPIILLRRRLDAEAPLTAPSVSYDLPELGVMLPYTPLQHLLLEVCAQRGVDALVMTSGNISEEPIEIDDDIAWEHLGGIADALLGNDRAILSRFDDSVVRVVDGSIMPVRRARGYAPQPLPLPAHAGVLGADVCVLACGPEQKATVAYTREDADGPAQCFVSQHIGDIENAATLDAWHDARARLEHLFDLHPTAIACDLHPNYLSSQWAREHAGQAGIPLLEIQHHHAHIASVIAEAACEGSLGADQPVVGIAFDGTGAGDDGTIWGGEFLVTSLTGYTRAARIKPWRLPGAAASVRDARRCALSLLAAHGLLDHPGAGPLLESLTDRERTITLSMVERGINSPLTSSMGRFLDACAAMLGICGLATYEGEPAIELEAAACEGNRPFAASPVDTFAGFVPHEPSGCPAKGKQEAPSHTHNRVISANTDSLDGEFNRATTAADLSGEQRRYKTGDFSQASPQIPSDGPAEPLDIDLGPVLQHLLDGIARGKDSSALAFELHGAIARAAADIAELICKQTGIRTVVLSGGVFMNRLLLEGTRALLEERRITVLIPHAVPVNDGCIAYGQAAIARARMATQAQR